MLVANITSKPVDPKVRYIIGPPEDYVEKEMFKRFKQKDLQDSVKAIIADEAHTSVTWAIDFRPKFGEISKLRAIFPDAPFLAMTGTATPEMRKAIKASLRLRKTVVVKTPVNRGNICLKVIQREPNSTKLSKEEVYDSIITPYMTRLAQEKSAFPKTIIYAHLNWIARGDNMSAEIDGALDHSSQYHAPLSAEVLNILSFNILTIQLLSYSSRVGSQCAQSVVKI